MDKFSIGIIIFFVIMIGLVIWGMRHDIQREQTYKAECVERSEKYNIQPADADFFCYHLTRL